MSIKSTSIPIQSIAHSATTGRTATDHQTVPVHPGTTVDNTIARYTGVVGGLQAYTSLPPSLSDDGVLLLPGQPVINVNASAAVLNVTGNGAVATIAYNTEITDIGGNFATPTFTASVGGTYAVKFAIKVSGITAAGTVATARVVTSNRSYRINDMRSVGVAGFTEYTFYGSVDVDMDANDTLTITLTGSGESANVWDIEGESFPTTFLTIHLVG